MRALEEFGLRPMPGFPQLLAEQGVRFAYLFGSRADGGATENSDADVACYFDGGDATSRFYRAAAIQRQIQKRQSVEVEVVALDDAGPVLRFEAMRPSVVLACDDEEFRIALEMRWRREYEDYRYRQTRHMKWLAEDLEEKRQCSTPE